MPEPVGSLPRPGFRQASNTLLLNLDGCADDAEGGQVEQSARRRGHQQGCSCSTGERTGWGARRDKQMQAAEKRLRQAEQETPPSAAESPENVKQAGVHSHCWNAPPALTESTGAAERQERLRAIASGLLYWKNGLKVLRQTQLPKWRGCFKWQIEAQIEALQAEYATLRAEVANGGG